MTTTKGGTYPPTVTYKYEVTNIGPPVTCVDDHLGLIGTFPPDASPVEKTVPVSDTTVNTVECSDTNGTLCCSDSVTVTKPPAPVVCVRPTSMVLEYTGPSVAGASVTAAGVTVFSGALNPGQQIAVAGSGGATLIIDINPAPASVSCIDTGNLVVSDPEEILHVSCSCRNTPATNLVLGNPVCLDSNSPDNTVSTCGGFKGAASPLWKLVSKTP
jgi:hypothetical protein